jgi:hypothetical protein
MMRHANREYVRLASAFWIARFILAALINCIALVSFCVPVMLLILRRSSRVEAIMITWVKLVVCHSGLDLESSSMRQRLRFCESLIGSQCLMVNWILDPDSRPVVAIRSRMTKRAI